jgi:mannose-1-phosphate guanylyltransferase
MQAVILCGGAGTRLWPISRQSSPKQFAQIFDKKSLFQLTIERNNNIVDGFIIVVNEKQLSLCKSQIKKEILSKTKFIIEPCARNTAPAISLAALLAPDETILILPSDHLIKNQKAYENSIHQANEFAQGDNLVTFGIAPTYPETGFGYIEANGNDVNSFKEKPSIDLAEKYIEQGNYFWNSGMFCFKAKSFLSELQSYRLDIFKASTDTFNKARVENNIYYAQLEDMKLIPAESIDYAVMEQSKSVKIVPADLSWSDLGSFDSLYNELEKDANGNTLSDNYIAYESKNNLILSSNKKLITTFNIDDLIIVETDDAILIGKKGESQNVKRIVETLQKSKSKLLD